MQSGSGSQRGSQRGLGQRGRGNYRQQVEQHVGLIQSQFDDLASLVGCVAEGTSQAKCVQGDINGASIMWLVDSGCPYTLISTTFAKKASLDYKEMEGGSYNLQAANGSKLREAGYLTGQIEIMNHKFECRVRVVDSLCFDAILGRDVLN
jgi:hypothetical protein